MTQHLTDYCQFSEHIYCLNPAAITNKQADGERWIKRDEHNQQKAYYYAEVAKTEPAEPNLPFEENATETWTDDKPF